MTPTLMRMALAGALAAAPLAGSAQQLVTASHELHLRAGPAAEFPLVAVLGPGLQVVVQGCLADYRWCDVSYGATRGWVHGMNLQYPWQDRWEPLPTVAAVVGVGVLAFVLHDYWRDHYRDRSWYRDRDRWAYPPARPPHAPPPLSHGSNGYHGYHGAPVHAPPPHGGPPRYVAPAPGQMPGPMPPRAAAPSPREGAHPPPPRRERVQPAPAPAPRVSRNDPNSGWDVRHPDAPRPDRP